MFVVLKQADELSDEATTFFRLAYEQKNEYEEERKILEKNPHDIQQKDWLAKEVCDSHAFFSMISLILF